MYFSHSFLAVIHHLDYPRLAPVRHRTLVDGATVDVIRRSRGLNPTEFNRFFPVVCSLLIPFTRANPQTVG